MKTFPSNIEIALMIQISILIILTFTFIAIYRQFLIQNKLFKAQLLKDRFEMYWNTYSPVTDEEVRSFKDFPDDWVSSELFINKYSDDEKKIRRYLSISKLYEYLAFTHQIQLVELPDLLGDQWLEKWTNDLLDEEEFLDVHHYYEDYYPEFQKFVNFLHAKKKNNILYNKANSADAKKPRG